MHVVSGAQLNDHSYSVIGPSNSNVEIDHPYTCTTLRSVSWAHDIQGTETIQGTYYFDFRVPGDGNCFFNSLSLALNETSPKSVTTEVWYVCMSRGIGNYTKILSLSHIISPELVSPVDVSTCMPKMAGQLHVLWCPSNKHYGLPER